MQSYETSASDSIKRVEILSPSRSPPVAEAPVEGPSTSEPWHPRPDHRLPRRNRAEPVLADGRPPAPGPRPAQAPAPSRASSWRWCRRRPVPRRDVEPAMQLDADLGIDSSSDGDSLRHQARLPERPGVSARGTSERSARPGIIGFLAEDAAYQPEARPVHYRRCRAGCPSWRWCRRRTGYPPRCSSPPCARRRTSASTPFKRVEILPPSRRLPRRRWLRARAPSETLAPSADRRLLAGPRRGHGPFRHHGPRDGACPAQGAEVECEGWSSGCVVSSCNRGGRGATGQSRSASGGEVWLAGDVRPGPGAGRPDRGAGATRPPSRRQRGRGA